MQFFNGFNLYIDKQKEYKIISIDLGHGDTSAARIGPDGKIDDMQVADGKTVVRSILGYDEKGNPCIGEVVGSMPEIYPYFKERPDLLDEYLLDGRAGGRARTRKQVMHDFLKVLMDNIYKYNYPHIKKDDRLILFVGCPSDPDWDQLKHQYADLIRQATGISRVAVLPESRAAIINALEMDQKIIIDEGIIVFDFGSLTSDCTYIIPRSDMVADFSITLGASMVEENMLRSALKSLSEKVLVNMTNTKIQLREWKEFFFLKKFQEQIVPIERSDSSQFLILKVNQKLMDMALRGRGSDRKAMQFCIKSEVNTWYGHCLDFFRAAKEKLEKNNAAVKHIIITGGASRMPFIMELCREVFGEGGISYSHEENPQFSVSKGLCFAGYKDLQAFRVFDDVHSSILKKVQEKLDQFSGDVAKKMASMIYDVALKEIKDWKQRSGTATLRQLSHNIEIKMKQIITPEMLSDLTVPAAEQWLHSVHDEITDSVNTAFQKIYGNTVSVDVYRLTDARWKRIHDTLTGRSMINSSQVDFSEIFKNIDVSGIAILACKVVVVIVAAMIASFLAAVLVPFQKLANFFLDTDYSFDETFDTIINAMDNWLPEIGADLDKELKENERENLYDKFSNKSQYVTIIEKKIYPMVKSCVDEQYDGKDGFGIGKAVQDALGEAINKIALQSI